MPREGGGFEIHVFGVVWGGLNVVYLQTSNKGHDYEDNKSKRRET